MLYIQYVTSFVYIKQFSKMLKGAGKKLELHVVGVKVDSDLTTNSSFAI